MSTKDWHTPISKEIIHDIHTVLDFARENTLSDLYADLPIVSGSQETFLEELQKIPTVSATELIKHKEKLIHYPEKDIRYLVSEFDLDNWKDLFLYAQNIDAEWDTVADEVAAYTPRVAIMTVPLSWQLGPMFYKTCRKKNVPVSVLSPRNPPLITQLIKETEAQMVVATSDVAEDVFNILKSEGLQEQVRLWHIVAPLNKKVTIPQLSGDTSIEYHLFPGIPIGYTNPSSKQDSLSFLPSPEYFFEVINDCCYITSLKCHTIPLIRFAISTNTSVDQDGHITIGHE
ncbi:hypothetical protein HQ403_01980 [Candidatus Kaiserbacteria bacterium]|nr:hypothetical protein [Candidatus Kaiserbacteria bacterium]